MVQVSIHVRPTTAYHHPNKIDHLLIDSVDRLEIIQEKFSTAGSTTRLYYGDHELPLNSSIGSHNFDDGAILECCRSPAMSAALSACLKDFDKIKKLPVQDRTMENLISILQTPANVQNDPDHEIWENWSNDKLKTRTINLATIKAVLQRQHRYNVHDLPKCNDCQSLFDALEEHSVWTGGNNNGTSTGRSFKQHAHIFKPQKKDGNPTTNWILVQEKLRIQNNIRREFATSTGSLQFTHGYDSPPIDWLEEFVRRDHARHCSDESRSSSGCNNAATDPHLAYLTPPGQKSPSRSNGSRTNTNRSLSVGATSSPARSASYIPQYASGPFAVLAALHLAMHSKHQQSNGRRLLTLTEDQLKRMAQPLCRSNLYDKARIRGRNAFACMDGLIEKQLVRKEIVRNAGGAGAGEVEKWGLLQNAEVLGEKCAEFDRAVNHVIPIRNIKNAHRKSNMNLVLCLDTREDVHLLERIKMSCDDKRVPYIEKELPAGDYLFIDQAGPQEEYVLPLVVERKSWSDLADSCQGKGRALNRLDCVKLGSSTASCSGNCQLCKMKRCGCKRVIFIIEGERCLGSDSVHRTAKKCTRENCCSACKLLSERHDVTQDELEGVLHRLQVEHGCYIIYTKSYNETISSLFDMRTLLQTESNPRFGNEERLSFESYATNARRKSSTTVCQVEPRPTRVQDVNVETMVALASSCDWDLDLVRYLCAESPINSPSHKKSKKSDDLVIELDSSDDGESSIVMGSAGYHRQNNKEMIYLDSDSDDLVTEIRGGGDAYSLSSSDDDMDELSCEEVVAPRGESGCDPLSNISRFSRDEWRKSMVASSDSDGSSSDDSIISVPGNKESARKLPALSPPAPTMVGKHGSISSNVAKKLLFDIDDDDDDDDYSHGLKPCRAITSSASATASTMKMTSRKLSPPSRRQTSSTIKKRKAGTELLSTANVNDFQRVYPLLIVHGWDDYDRQFHHRIDKMWKEIYLSTSDSNRMNDFYTESISRLDARIQESGFAFVRRRTLIRFTLWMQLSLGVQIRSVQRMRFAEEIKSHFRQRDNWLEGSVVQPLAFSPVTSAPASTSLKRHSTPVASSPIFNLGPTSTPNVSLTRRTSGSASMRGEKNYPTSSSRDVSAVREARLKRFDNHSIERHETQNRSTWSCKECTYENNLVDGLCEMCGCVASARLSSTTIRNWSCSRCTFQNTIDSDVCFACDTMNKSPGIGSRNVPAELPSIYYPSLSKGWAEPITSTDTPTKSTSKRVARCGACGNENHTRANATEFNCPAYYDDKEVDRREKIRLKREETIANEQANIRAIEKEAATNEKMQAEIARLNEELKRNNERTEAFRKEELKRKKQKVKRLQKRLNGT